MKSRSSKQQRKLHAAAKRRRNRLKHIEQLEARRMMAGDLVTEEGYVDGNILVQFTNDATLEQKQGLVQQYGGTVEASFRSVNGFLMGVPTVTNETDLASTIMGLPYVEYAGVNQVYTPERVPNDPLFDLQWGLNNTGQDPTAGTPDADIDAPEAWDIFQGSAETVVAVLDSGVDYTHPDLLPNLWRNPFEVPGNGVDDDGNGYVDDLFGIDASAQSGDPVDNDGHGTSVAGVIAAAGNNNIGISGVGWNTKVMAIKLGDAGFAAADIVLGYDYLIDMKQRGVNVVASNNSFGSYPGMVDPIIFAAVNATIEAGVVYVASAGNASLDTDITFHAQSGYDLDGIISVASTDRDDQLSDFSNWGEVTVDLAAPGDEVLSTIPMALVPTTPGFPMGYDAVSGTSFAAPHVAGAVALAAGLNPTLSVAELKAAVLDSVDLLTNLTGTSVTGGRLNIGRMLADLPAGRISGQVFTDTNMNGVRDTGESGAGGFTVFTDVNANGVLDGTEPSTVTSFDGTYSLPHYLGPGSYSVMVVGQSGTLFTSPADGQRTVTATGYQDTISGVNFGVKGETVGVSGTVTQDNGDPNVLNDGVPGVYVYADTNMNGRADISEIFDITDEDGNYSLPLPSGTIADVNVQVPPGWSVLSPVDGYAVDLTGVPTLSGLDFLLSGQLMSYGTAPSTYGDASAGILGGFQIGDNLFGAVDKDGAVQAAAAGDPQDGISFASAFTEGAAVVPTVDIHTNGQTRGYFNGWIDFDRNGEFSDDEQVIKNARLGEGTHTLPAFTIPGGVDTGDTWARFRYGWEYDVTAEQEAFAGEVQDFPVTVFGNEPVAVDDNFSVDQNSDFLDNDFDVLANDVVSAVGGDLSIVAFDTTSDEGGSVRMVGDNLQYEPVFGFFGPDSFTYTVADNSGAMSTATVTVFVSPSFDGPVAIDDMYSRAANFVGQPVQTYNLRVTDNDIPSLAGSTFLNQVTEPATNGTAIVFTNQTATRDDDVIAYTPNPGFQGTDQFSYEIIDSNGLVSEATVTMQIGNVDGDDIVDYSIGFSLPDGTPISEISEGTPFFVDVYVQDLRTSPVFPAPPATQVDRRGVFAAYVDVLFDNSLLTVTGAPTRVGAGPVPSSPFLSRQDGTTFIPGVVDELGGITPTDLNDSPPPTGTDPLLIARIPVVAQPGSAGANATVYTDPADLLGVDVTDEINEVSGIHDTLIFEPSTDVEVNEMRFSTSQITINGGAAAQGEAHNRFTPTDVNNDRITNVLDLRDTFVSLLVSGAGPAAGSTAPAANGAEGEAGSYRQLMVDVNNDGQRSLADLRIVLNAVMGAGSTNTASPEAEGEAGSFASSSYEDAPESIYGPDTESIDLLLATHDDSPVVSDAVGAASRETDRLLAELDADFFSDIDDVWND